MEESKQKTAKELKEFYTKYGGIINNFERAQNALQLIDPSNIKYDTASTFNKETLRTYLANPLRYHEKLIELSRYLYNVSKAYNRMINDNASMINLDYKSIIPKFDGNTKLNTKKMTKSFYDTSNFLAKINLKQELYKAYKRAWIEDVFFGCIYYDDTGIFILPLPSEYCQITSIYPTGDYGFDFDCSYFSNRQTELELWGEPFITLYNEYQKDQVNGKWQPFPDENCICFKIGTENITIPTPPYLPFFNSLIDLEDLSGITAIADAQRIYKLLVAQIPTLNNTGNMNDWAVDPEIAIQYFQQMLEKLPDYVDGIISPIEVTPINFDHDQTTDINKIENATSNILKSSGHIALTSTGATAISASIQSDENYVIGSLLPQTEAWLNRFVGLHVNNPCYVKLLKVTEYTKDKYKDSLIKGLNYGTPLITTLGILDGYSEVEQIAMAQLNDALGIRNLFKPYDTASTRSTEDTKTETVDSEASADKTEQAG